jgi:GNAT superfamily N-acetyltransferase
MRTEEKKALLRVMRRAFSPIQQIFFSWKDHVLVAEREGALVGGTVLDTFPLAGGRKGGIVLWIFTDPDVRGRGAGQALAEGAIAFFEAEGCTDMFACVEGYNTSSSKLFATRGFGILSPGAQFRRYGLGTFAMWYHTFHFIDIGHFLWTRPPAERPDSPALQWWGVWLMNTVIVWLALWRQHNFQASAAFQPFYLLTVPLVLLTFFGARSLAMLAAARAQGLTLRYRAWESGFPLGVVIALSMGGLYPNPGGFYPTTDRWRYREWLPQLGPVALAGIAPTLLLTWGLWALREFGPLTARLGQATFIAQGLNIAWILGVSLSVLDVLTPFFPLASFNGRRLWDWKPWLWGVCALATAALFFV